MAPDTALIDLLIAEDQDLFRIGLKMSLQQVGSFNIFEAVNGLEAVDKAIQLQPSVVLMDIQMPSMDGIAATKAIKEQAPNVKVLMLTTYTRDDDVFAAFSAGADGYCVKDIRTDQLVRAIVSVRDGAAWLDPAIATRVLKAEIRETAPAKTERRKSKGEQPFALSQRENQVLALVCEGLSNQEIADRLFVSYETIKTHVRNIMDKLVVSDRTQAAVKAIREGII